MAGAVQVTVVPPPFTVGLVQAEPPTVTDVMAPVAVLKVPVMVMEPPDMGRVVGETEVTMAGERYWMDTISALTAALRVANTD